MLQFEKWKVILILLVSGLGVLFALPNLFSDEELAHWPGFLPTSKINLGLDLQGGAHLLFEVDVNSVKKERLESLVDDIRLALNGNRGEKPRIGYTNLGLVGDVVKVKIINPDKVSEAMTRIKNLGVPVKNTVFGTSVADIAVTKGKNQFIEVRVTPEALKAMGRSAVDQSIEIVRRRIDELGTREPTIQRQGADRIIVQVPGVGDPQRIIDLIGQTAKLTFHMVDTSIPVQEAMNGRVPPRSMLLPSENPNEPFVLVFRRAEIGGERLVNSQQGFDQRTGQPIVSFRFDSAGARRFADLSRENVGRRFAIVLDNKVISAPVIREPILGGSGQISGNFTIQSASDLSILLRAGALPAPLNVIEQRTVGPELGADSIAEGEVAAVIGFVIVVTFILLSYSLFGLFANLALVLNLILLMGTLSLLGATLTLPGIAGIVLTVGMAVDANVLIFERIKEELRAGKSSINAVEAGYARALGTIMDANITTLIAAVILFFMGSGPVKGFAVTLAIGIMTSVFTAFTVTRLIVAMWLRRRRPQTIPV